ncbi:hypothetical protein WR25_04797 [Diploscapter pachys]|uniref:Uncharacterized protein n=1 Tax=Diploscapter pachys TaxID=2018661 RepID=A0A2A2JY13_9BILA|nr:hypothetical protein WR25_04797 [Diploscapter pachys]
MDSRLRGNDGTEKGAPRPSMLLRDPRQLADEADQPGLARALQAFGREDRLHAAEAFLDVVIDQDIVIAVPVAHLVGGACHARVNHLGRIGVPIRQPRAQFLHRGWEDEHAYHVAAGDLE